MSLGPTRVHLGYLRNVGSTVSSCVQRPNHFGQLSIPPARVVYKISWAETGTLFRTIVPSLSPFQLPPLSIPLKFSVYVCVFVGVLTVRVRQRIYLRKSRAKQIRRRQNASKNP